MISLYTSNHTKNTSFFTYLKTTDTKYNYTNNIFLISETYGIWSYLIKIFVRINNIYFDVSRLIQNQDMLLFTRTFSVS